MNQVEIQIVKSQELQSLLTSRLHIFRLMEGVPQFADNKDILPFAVSLVKGSLETSAHFALIAIDKCTVNVTIANLQSMLNSSGNLARLGLPRSKANEWHGRSRRKLGTWAL